VTAVKKVVAIDSDRDVATPWQPHLRRDYSPESARQATENVAGFFDLLSRWDPRAAESSAPNGAS
jgi:hypothetical protein